MGQLFRVLSLAVILWRVKSLNAFEDVHLNLDDMVHTLSSRKGDDADFIPMGHLAALKREEMEFSLDKLNLNYLDHPWERQLQQPKNKMLRGLSEARTDTSMDSGVSPSFAPARKEQSFLGFNNTTHSPSLDPSLNPSLNPSEETISPSEFRTRSPSHSPTMEERLPLRIVFETTELDNENSTARTLKKNTQILKEEILPRISRIWSSILNVVPVEGNITVNSNTCYSFYDISTSLIQYGVPNTDLLVFVSGYNQLEGRKLCSRDILASASHCSLDQFDRPVIGFVNFCLENISMNNLDAAVAIGVHELAHILGFNDDLFQYFRDSDGNPLTKRPFKKTKVDCVDGSKKLKVIASEKTIKKRNNIDSVYYEIVTPMVVEITRNHFDCPSLQGARLENQPTRKSCTGGHWDERFFFTDTMSPIFSSEEVSILSPLTVALIKDTGWYDVSFASEYIKNNPFGLGAGCEFLNEDSCIVDDKVPERFEPYFCDSVTYFNMDGKISGASITSCDPSFTHIAYCDLFDFTTTLPKDVKTNQQVDVSMFSDPNLGSIFGQTDNCPLPAIFRIDCTDSLTPSKHKLYAEEQYGTDSKCFNSILEHPVKGGIPRGVCLKSHCNQQKHTLEVFLGKYVITCKNEGDVHTFPYTDDVTFICPKLSSICPQMFCPSMCSGQGLCNYGLDPPQCECYDKNDISPGCYGIGVQYNLDDDYNATPPMPENLDPNKAFKHVSTFHLIIAITIIFMM